MPRSLRAALSVCLVLISAAAAHAQEAPPVALRPSERIAPFVVDARGTFGRFKQPAGVAADLGVAATDLPTRGLGLVVGAHLYPVRRQNFALGIGGELLLRARASKTVPLATEGGADGPTVVTRMTALSPQLSLNFGKRNGWSYLSGGIGWASIASELSESPLEDTETRPRAINYGGGARWFVKEHVALSLDLRFYAISPQDASATRPGFPRMTVMVFSAGVSLR